MTRARGANALLGGAFETVYGTPPAEFLRLPFVSANLGEEQGLLEDDLLGMGRESQDPDYDVIVNDGDVVAPVDSRLFGFWLKSMFAAPVTTASGAASLDLTFSAQPTDTSTITLAGTVWTFVSGSPSGNQIQIAGTLALTLAAVVTALNGSAIGAIAAATYSAVGGTKLHIVFDTAGPAGNAYTVVVSAGSRATIPSATLTGGTNAHVFTSGALVLPSMSLEIGLSDIAKYFMNFGCMSNQMKIALAAKGKLNATMSLICQGELPATSAAADASEAVADVFRFAQATGSIKKDGVELGDITSGNIAASNNLDKIEVIRRDMRIAGADPAKFMASGDVSARFGDMTLYDAATGKTPIDLSYGWARDSHSLTFDLPRVFLPRTKRPITGPAGIQAQFNWQASGALGHAMTATLVNDQPGTLYA